MGRTAKFGYVLKNTDVQISEKEAAIVAEIYEDYKKGMSTSKIARKLNSQSIKYYENGNDWSRNTISYILKDRTYIGNEDYPQIVTEDTFNTVQRLLDKNVHRIPEEEKPYAEMFKEKMRCSECRSIIIRKSMEKGNKEKVIMKCSNEECVGNKNQIKQMHLEALIKSVFERIGEHEELIEAPLADPTDISKNTDIIKMTNELRFKMQDSTIAEADILIGIQNIASARFRACTSRDNTEKTKQIKERILGCKGRTRISADVIGEVIQRILLAPDKTVVIKMKNGVEFTERME